MSLDFSYSVAIRTLGTAGEKYERLLHSVSRQTIQPEKIVVVLPRGFTPPEPVLGIERFVFSDKGMVPQRLEALKYIDSDYVLFCDDDVEFIPEYIERIADGLLNHGCNVAAGPLLSFFPPKGIVYLVGSIVGEASVMLRGRKDTYVRILGTGGFSYNRSIDLNSHKIYKTESMAGTCFCASVKAMKAVDMDDELWLEKNGFAAWEDRVMLSKLTVNGYKACIVSDAEYAHNDGKTSVKKLRLEPVFARGFNHYVYWHRFLYTPAKGIRRAWLKWCIGYYKVMFNFYFTLRILARQSQKEERGAWNKGFNAGREYCKSEEYKRIPDARLRTKN